MIAFLKLIRWPNILIIWLAMGLTLFGVVNPVLSLRPFEAGMSPLELLLLVTAVTSMAIAGYLVNDIHDMNTDSVNKPGKNMVGKKFSVQTVRVLYWVFNLLGLAAGVYFTYLLGRINYSLIFIFSAGLLWFYSERYQCQPLIGNLVIAFLTALTILLVWLFSFFALLDRTDIVMSVQPYFKQVNALIWIFSGFAFVTTLIREMVKDMQDFKGDDRFGCETLAVAVGVEKTRRWTMFVLVAAVLFTLYSQWYFFMLGLVGLFYFFFVIDLLFFGVIFRLAKAKVAENFKGVSLLIKVLMVAGILSMILVYLAY